MKTKCNLCGSNKSKILYRVKRSGFVFSPAKCMHCGLVFLDTTPSESEITKFYSKKYYSGKGFDKTINYCKGIKKSSAYTLFNKRLKNIEKFSKKGKILDIGCGLGEFLIAARWRGW